jgi:hypothetical protein
MSANLTKSRSSRENHSLPLRATYVLYVVTLGASLYLALLPRLLYLAGFTYSPLLGTVVIPAGAVVSFVALLFCGVVAVSHLIKLRRSHSPFHRIFHYVIIVLIFSGPIACWVKRDYMPVLRGFGDRLLARTNIAQIRSWMDQLDIKEGESVTFSGHMEHTPEFIRQLRPYSVVVQEDPFGESDRKPWRFADLKWPAVVDTWGLHLCPPELDSPLISKSEPMLRLEPGVYVYERIK